MENNSVKERLQEYLQYKRIKQVDFARRIGASPAYVAAMRRSISDEKVMQIRNAFPDLNTDWLLYGQGEMLMPEKQTADGFSMEDYIVPLIPIDAHAGALQLYSEGVQLRDCEKIMSPVSGADFAIRISGDSMEPEIHDGSYLFIKRINEAAFIPWGNNLVIDTENGTLVKAVYPSTRKERPAEWIEARSKNPKYPPIEIPTSSIFGLYRILGEARMTSTI